MRGRGFFMGVSGLKGRLTKKDLPGRFIAPTGLLFQGYLAGVLPRAVGGPYLMLASVLLGVGVGYLLDRNYLTTPRWTVGLGLFGIAVGLYHAVREASR